MYFFAVLVTSSTVVADVKIDKRPLLPNFLRTFFYLFFETVYKILNTKHLNFKKMATTNENELRTRLERVLADWEDHQKQYGSGHNSKGTAKKMLADQLQQAFNDEELNSVTVSQLVLLLRQD